MIGRVVLEALSLGYEPGELHEAVQDELTRWQTIQRRPARHGELGCRHHGPGGQRPAHGRPGRMPRRARTRPWHLNGEVLTWLGAECDPRRARVDMKQANPVSITIFLLILAAGGRRERCSLGQFATKQSVPWILLASFLPAFFFLFAVKIANQWEKAVVLRFGKFQRLAGPGLFWIDPHRGHRARPGSTTASW